MTAGAVERWRPVVGFESIYEVSDQGRVRRVGKAHRTGKGRGGGAQLGRILRDQRGGNDYRVVFLFREGRQHAVLVHRLVAAAFIGPCPRGKEVNHRDGDKSHNAEANLEYVTRSQNVRHAYRLGLRLPSRVGRPRQPRVTVPCECGCGASIETPDSKGRARRYVSGHNARVQTRARRLPFGLSPTSEVPT